MRYKGSCHCGRIAYEVEGQIKSLTECNCSICSRRGYRLWFVPRSRVQFLAPVSVLSNYMFNTHKIEHRFCPVCGCAPFGLSTDGTMAAINARCIQNADLSKVPVTHHDGRSN